MTDPDNNNNNNNNNNNAELKTTSLVLCSICLDDITDDVDRSTAKLHCGHRFHLDCIGSAFNIKGAMQCPNCRKIEQGHWLYASGPNRTIPDITMDNWALYDDRFGLSYPEMPYNIHWCPFSGLARVPAAFEAVESLPPAYHNLNRNQNMFAEHGGSSYVAFLRPIPSASSNNETIEDPNFNYNWNGVSNSHPFPITDMYNRNSRGHFDAMTRSRPYIHPFLYGLGRSHERLQPSHSIRYPPQPTNHLGMPSTIISSRFHGHWPQPHIHANSVSNRNGSYFIIPSQGSSVPISHETENLLPVILSNGAGSDSNRMGNFWHRHRS